MLVFMVYYSQRIQIKISKEKKVQEKLDGSFQWSHIDSTKC